MILKFKSLISLFVILLFFSGCQTVKNKTDAIVEKENEKLSKFIGKSSSEVQMELGKPDEDFKNEKGNFELVYNTKKYLIPCERRFEINPNNIVIGFVSNGCF
jgi:outer membrane lipoprotein-sorting protein